MSDKRLLHAIDSPADLRDLSRDQVEQVADEIIIAFYKKS